LKLIFWYYEKNCLRRKCKMKKRNLASIFAILGIILTTFNFSITANAAGYGNFATQNLVGGDDKGYEFSITFVAEGYTASEQEKFITEASNYANYLKTVSPFSEFNGYINVHAVKVISNQSGIGTTEKDTFFRAYLLGSDCKIKCSGNATYG
jgi:hypothetical protein